MSNVSEFGSVWTWTFASEKKAKAVQKALKVTIVGCGAVELRKSVRGNTILTVTGVTDQARKHFMDGFVAGFEAAKEAQ